MKAGGPEPCSGLGRPGDPQEWQSHRKYLLGGAGSQKGGGGVLILAAEVWPRPRQDSNPGSVLTHPPEGSPVPAACPPAPFTSPLSHTGCQEAEDPRIPALPQLLPLAWCPAAPSCGRRGQLPGPMTSSQLPRNPMSNFKD